MKKIISFILATSMIISCSIIVPNLSCRAAGSTSVSNIANCVGTWCNKTYEQMNGGERLQYHAALASSGASAPQPNGMLEYMKMNFLFQIFTTVVPIGLKAIYMSYSHWRESRKNCGKILDIKDPIATLQNLDIGLFSLKGQEKAKKQIRSMILNIITKKNHKLSSDKNGATVIYMVGPSGVGKSYSSEILTKILTGSNSKPYIIEASDIDKQSKASPVEQLFGMRTLRVGPWETYEKSPLINQIKSTPKMVVLINEYDKMHSPEMDEKLRTIMDQGYIKVNGETIDCSGVTFIITSNESSGSVNNGNQDTENVDDGTGSRTFIKHDKAFLNRIHLIEFENLSTQEYQEIAETPCKELAMRFLQEYKILIDLRKVPQVIAERTSKLNKGARPIYNFIEELNTKILDEVILKGRQDKNYTGKIFGVSYDETENEFKITELALPKQLNEQVEKSSQESTTVESINLDKQPKEPILSVSQN
ncbi:MAG: hypothetical protein RUMPE_00383 [Eubacteriales bacterium SKADARSKE-1]|nr:hypothetical protein [Eubacteriales bacterium SKADARSKE-1]